MDFKCCGNCINLSEYYGGDNENPPEPTYCPKKSITFIPMGIENEIEGCDEYVFKS